MCFSDSMKLCNLAIQVNDNGQWIRQRWSEKTIALKENIYDIGMFLFCISNFNPGGKSVRHLQFFKCSVCQLFLCSNVGLSGILCFRCQSAFSLGISCCFIY